MTITKKLFLGFGACVSLASAAQATLIFDSGGAGVNSSNRTAGSSPGTYVIKSGTDITIDSIAVHNDLNAGGNIKFLIFDHNTHNPIFISAPLAFTDDGFSWKQSSVFAPVTLQAGVEYDIGAIADVGGLWSYDELTGSMNGITSFVSNVNFSDYATPSAGGHAAADAAVRLYSNSTSVPDGGATLALFGLALGGLRLVGKRF